MWRKLHPAVPKHWLFAIAGVVWLAAGTVLFSRAVLWLIPSGLTPGFGLEMLGLVVAVVCYLYGFSKIVQKNILRIHDLPDPVCAFAFTAWKGYAMIAIMVTIGITLRNSSIPKYYLAVAYSAMGGMLVMGSIRFFRQFRTFVS